MTEKRDAPSLDEFVAERDVEIVRRAGAGEPYQDIARAAGLSFSRISQICLAAGIRRRHPRVGGTCGVRRCQEPTGTSGSARGWCQKHYLRWWKYGDPLYVTPPGRPWSTTPQATESPSLPDLHWAAGFLEGEGCFTPASSTGSSSDSIDAKQVQKWPLERLRELFGGRIVHRPRSRPHWSDAWVWRVHGPRARGVMLTLYGLLSPRRQERIREAFNG